ncbi:HAD family hydrolase [Bacteroides sp.]|uniref:HAD family hydrolase n=1 Tax=Bacteroides sp. TaxID=29523 RepID=UPI003AAB3433
MKRKIIVFDLDDTLYKEVDFLKSAYQEIASWLEDTYELKGVYNYMLFCYEHGMNVFLSVNHEYRLSVPLEIYLSKYRLHFPTLYLSELVESFLARMCKEECALGLITDGRSITQSNKIKALGLGRYIAKENCIISESFGYSKPSLEPFLYFQHKYQEGDFYYIGDNVIRDFVAPNQLGWTTICLRDDGRNIHKQIPISHEMKPQYEISSFRELYKLVEMDL